MNTLPPRLSSTETEQSVLPLSVIVPTCNPRPEVIQATLAALRAQTLPLDQWELIVVDNNSQPPLDTILDLSWHPSARSVVEKRPGAQQARARGLRESRGELVVNVDDDNFLAPNYLAAALKLASEQPQLGVWGGHIEAEYEAIPPDWVHHYAYHLAICEFERASWSSFVDDRSIPYGAGMCIRRIVVDTYLERLKTENISRFGRNDRGSSTNFVAGEDQILVYTATLLGFAVGRFPELRMRHRIPKKRYDPEYFLKLVRGNSHGALLVQLHHQNSSSYRTFFIWPIVKYLLSSLLYRGMKRRVLCAQARGEIDALWEARRTAGEAPLGVSTGHQPGTKPTAPEASGNSPAAPDVPVPLSVKR